MTDETNDVEALARVAGILNEAGRHHLADAVADAVDALCEIEEERKKARSVGQVAFEASGTGGMKWESIPEAVRKNWAKVANAVIDFHEQQPVWDERIDPTPAEAVERCQSAKGDKQCMRGADHDGKHEAQALGGPMFWQDEEAPAWEPTVGAWAEHREHGRVLILRRAWLHGERARLCARPVWAENKPATFWCPDADLSAPRPRVWSRAEDVPEHVVVTDKDGIPRAGVAGQQPDPSRLWAPFTEVVGGVW